jgi:hypothetical protein
MCFWPTSSALLGTMPLIGRASFRRAPVILIEYRVVLGSDRLRLTIARRR